MNPLTLLQRKFIDVFNIINLSHPSEDDLLQRYKETGDGYKITPENTLPISHLVTMLSTLPHTETTYIGHEEGSPIPTQADPEEIFNHLKANHMLYGFTHHDKHGLLKLPLCFINEKKTELYRSDFLVGSVK